MRMFNNSMYYVQFDDLKTMSRLSWSYLDLLKMNGGVVELQAANNSN